MSPPWIDNTRGHAVWLSIIFYKLKFKIEYGSKIKILLFEFELFESIGTEILVEDFSQGSLFESNTNLSNYIY